MSARDELYGLASQDFPVGGDEIRAAMDAYDREHAHELAEKQRAALEADPGLLEPALINLIDPHCKDCRCLCHLADPSPCDDCREEVLNSGETGAVQRP